MENLMPTDQVPEYGECPECGKRTIPALELLPCGHEGEPIVRQLEAEGTIYAWTRSWTSPDTSTILAMVDFMDGTLRAAAPVIETDQVNTGDLVRARVGDETPLSFAPIMKEPQ
jgi:uncharacterized OB-fold protein